MARILIALSGADHWTLKDGSKHPTGFWAEEFAVPHRIFREAGTDIVVATPAGVQPTVDERSLAPEMNGGDEGKVRELREYLDAIAAELEAPSVLEDQSAEDFDAVYVPGGHGPMEDLAQSAATGDLLTSFFESGRLVAAICHGPAALLPARRPDGSWTFAGLRMTAFTDEEEEQAGLADKAPWLLEDRLRELGAVFEAGPAWESYVVVDGNFLSGQNPASSEDAARRTLAQLESLTR